MTNDKLLFMSFALSPVLIIIKWVLVSMMDLKKTADGKVLSVDESDALLMEKVKNMPKSKPSKIFAFVNKKYGFLVPIIVYGLVFYITQQTYPKIITSTPIFSILLIVVIFMSIHSFCKVRDKKYKQNVDWYNESGQREAGYSNVWISMFGAIFEFVALGCLNFFILNLFLNFSINFLSVLSLILFVICSFIAKKVQNFIDKYQSIFYGKKILYNLKNQQSKNK